MPLFWKYRNIETSQKYVFFNFYFFSNLNINMKQVMKKYLLIN